MDWYESPGHIQVQGWHISKLVANDTLALSGFISAQEDQRGYLWLAAKGTMQIKDNLVYVNDLDIKSSVIFSISKHENTICFSGNRGTDCFENNKGIHFNTQNGLKHQVVHDALKDKLGQFWFATRKGGLNMMDKEGQWHYYLDNINCRKLLELTNGDLWIGTSNGAVLLNTKTKTFDITTKGFAMLPFHETQDGEVIFATEGQGVFVYDENWRQFNTENSILKNNVVHTVIEDSNGVLWLGFDQGFQTLKYSDLYGH